ncbi:MAG: hypothetical protein MJ198_05070 [Bacteroidales bacterium]|nr:hypothetical protein [Bacteroidales bacterium]
MNDILFQWAGYVLTPITGIVSWIAASRQREKTLMDGLNDSLKQMQETINMLVEKNKQQLDEIIELRSENASLRADVAELKEQLGKMK